MKIAYTISDTDVNFINSNGITFAKWNSESTEKSSLGLSFDEIKKYIQSPKRLISEGTNIYITINDNGEVNTPIFKMIETNQTKMGGMEFIKYKSIGNVVGQIYIPFADSADEEYTIRLNIREENVSKLLSLVPDAVKVENEDSAFATFYYEHSPRVSLVDVKKEGDWSKVKVQLTYQGSALNKSNVRVFAKSASGYIAKTEVYTDANGQAEFKVQPLGLDSGETMKVEIGFKYISNIVSADVAA